MLLLQRVEFHRVSGQVGSGFTQNSLLGLVTYLWGRFFGISGFWQTIYSDFKYIVGQKPDSNPKVQTRLDPIPNEIQRTSAITLLSVGNCKENL